MKIIIFPFAGGNKYSYNFFSPNKLNINVLEYSGRGTRVNEHLFIDINKLVNDLLLRFKSEINSSDPYIIYGHSMGGLVGYLICKEIERLGLNMPTRLVISGRKAPNSGAEKLISDLSNEDFWKEITKLGGVPEEIEKHPELIKYFTPILKADFKCIENYQYDQDAPKLTIPIDIFYGSDEEITKEEAEEWQEETTSNVNVNQLKGNHFFIFDHKEFFIDYFKNSIT